MLARPTRGSRTVLALCGVALVLLAVACDGADGKLKAVRDLAHSAAAAEPVFTAIATDFYASCVRQYNWELAASPDPAAFDPLDKWCGGKYALEGSQQWQKTNLMLLSYMRGLGDLAAGQGNDYGIPEFVDDFKKLNSKTKWFDLNDSTWKTIIQFGTWITEAHFAAKRKEALAEVTRHADSYVKALTLGLTQIATQRYGEQLRLENLAITKFYDRFLPKPPVIVPLADLAQSMRDRQAVANRYAAIETYASALDEIAKGHSGLVKVLNGASAADPAVRDHLLAAFARDVAILAHTYVVQGGPK